MRVSEISKRIDISSSVGILGGGVSAKGVQLLLKKLNKECVVYDIDPKKGKIFSAQDAKDHSLIVTSPSFFQTHPWVKIAQQSGCLCVSELDFAQNFCPARIVGITGTNGKTTITKCLSEFFQSCGRKAYFAGNIGVPLSEVTASYQLSSQDIIFCEISSFQAMSLKYLNLVALIWSNFYPSHLNVHSSVEEYFNAKYRLTKLLGPDGLFFCGTSVEKEIYRRGYCFPKNSTVCKVQPKHEDWYLNSAFKNFPQHENFELILSFCQKFDNFNGKTFLSFAKKFHLPRYRLEFLGNFGGNVYWNDSKCTNFHALSSALQNFKQPVIWIGGGRSKGENIEDIVPCIAGKVEKAFLIGEVAERVVSVLNRNGVSAENVKSIENALFYVKKSCIQNKDIVFSPAFSSFDQFKNFEERGKYFEKCVLGLINL